MSRNELFCSFVHCNQKEPRELSRWLCGHALSWHQERGRGGVPGVMGGVVKSWYSGGTVAHLRVTTGTLLSPMFTTGYTTVTTGHHRVTTGSYTGRYRDTTGRHEAGTVTPLGRHRYTWVATLLDTGYTRVNTARHRKHQNSVNYLYFSKNTKVQEIIDISLKNTKTDTVNDTTVTLLTKKRSVFTMDIRSLGIFFKLRHFPKIYDISWDLRHFPGILDISDISDILIESQTLWLSFCLFWRQCGHGDEQWCHKTTKKRQF